MREKLFGAALIYLLSITAMTAFTNVRSRNPTLKLSASIPMEKK